MENVLFEDDMKEQRKWFIVLMVISLLCAAIQFGIVIKSGLSLETVVWLVAAICLVFAFGCWTYNLVRATIYKVTVIDNCLTVKKVFGSKSIVLGENVTFTCKKFSTSKYQTFKITVDGKRISVWTKKAEELILVLQQNGAVQQ